MKLGQLEAQREVVDALRISVDRFIADNPGVTQEVMESVKGMTKGLLSLQLGGHTPLAVATLVQAMDVMEGEYLEGLAALNRRYGKRAVSVVGAASCDIAVVNEKAAHAMRGVGELMADVMVAASDGKLSEVEERAVVGSIDEAQLRLDALRAAVLGVRAGKK